MVQRSREIEIFYEYNTFIFLTRIDVIIRDFERHIYIQSNVSSMWIKKIRRTLCSFVSL
jgi:hypothetical protein